MVLAVVGFSAMAREHGRRAFMLDDVERHAMRGASLAKAWGSARVNGWEVQDLVRVEVFERGVSVRLLWFFGRGSIWMPAETLRLSWIPADDDEAGVGRVVIWSGPHVVELVERLARPDLVLASIRRIRRESQ